MGTLFDYLEEAGRISLAALPFGAVDALILSALVYVPLTGLVPAKFTLSVPLGYAAASALDQPNDSHIQRQEEARLLKALARSPRFSAMGLTGCRERTDLRRQLQFGAMTVLPGDGSTFLAFRGTDATLVGWKENLNMSFLEHVPAQQEAAAYARTAALRFRGSLRLGGHSKGGNLAIFAGVSCPAPVRDRIKAIYNFDGPGFTDYLLSRPGYPELLSRTHTFVPRFSLVGALLDREGPCAVVDSSQSGLLQHDLYSWRVNGSEFALVQETAPLSRMAAQAVRDWLSGLTPGDRARVADTLYTLLSAGGNEQVEEALRPQNLPSLLRAAGHLEAGDLEHLVSSLVGLIRSAAQTAWG